MKKLLANDEENTPVISEDNISNQSEVLVKPVHTKALQISELNQCFRMRHYYLIFIFLSANTVGCAKYALPFLEVNLEVEHL